MHSAAEIVNAGPPTLEHVIGQKQAVEQLKVALAAYFNERAAGRVGSLGAILMVGPPGTGKSLLSRIIAAELAATVKETLGQTLGLAEDLNALLLEATDDTCVYIDEADLIPPAAQTKLFKAVEERVLIVPRGPRSRNETRIPLSKFTLILSTNHASGILAPLRERMSVVLHFDFYTQDELAALCRQRSQALRWTVEPEVFALIAAKSKQTPRLAIRLLRSCWQTARATGAETITADHFHRTLILEGLDAGLGLDKAEQTYLKALAEAGGKARLHLLSSRLSQPTRTVSEVIESFLIRQNLVTRSESGRELTEKGFEYVRQQYGL